MAESTLPAGKVQFTGTMTSHLRDNEPITIVGTLTEIKPPEEETPPEEPSPPAKGKK